MRTGQATTLLFAATMFLSSFLLFLVEPMQGKLLLPMLGGAPGVWNTCMVFFQAALLAGYLYAHVLSTRVPLSRQPWVHAVVLLLPLIFLPPALPALSLVGPPSSEHPFLWIMGTLSLASGPAFFALATTSPLLATWFHRSRAGNGRDPYALYAAGNAGSFLALLGYPLVVEPTLRLGAQARLWTFGYAAFALAVIALGVRMARSPARAARAVAADAADHSAPPVRWGDRISWTLLAAVPSSLMLGVTTFMTVDIAAIPMLWMLPLMLYILSFVVVFWRWPARADRIATRLVPWFVAVTLFLVFTDYRRYMWAIIAVHLCGFMLLALACHGRAALRRPAARHLTQFFFCLSLGGVLGGLLNTLIAPLVFDRIAEYPLVLALAVMLLAPWQAAPRWRVTLATAGACALFAGVLYGVHHLMNTMQIEPIVALVNKISDGDQAARAAVTFGLPLLLAAVLFMRPLYLGSALLGFCLIAIFYDADANVIFRNRSFFGALTVRSYESGLHSLVHGGIMHGEQKMATIEERLEPRSYYHREGPLGAVMTVLTEQVEHPKIAAVGLGSGTIAAYGTPNNDITFYELNPNVEKLARDPKYFTYVDDCLQRGCNLKVVIGDGRLQLEAATEKYDLIVLDAFSSDAIPVHLLTSEALATYLEHLTPAGLIAYHISNRYLDLEPVLYNLGKQRSLIYTVDRDDGDDATGRSGSSWVVMAARDDLIGTLLADQAWTGLMPKRGVGVWADDYANVTKTFTWY